MRSVSLCVSLGQSRSGGSVGGPVVFLDFIRFKQFIYLRENYKRHRTRDVPPFLRFGQTFPNILRVFLKCLMNLYHFLFI